MSSRVVIAAMLGFAVGDLPDHGATWALVKVAFTIAVLVLAFRLARRSA